MLDALFKLLGGKGEKSSHQIAHDRLKVVLIHDRANISPEIMDRLREDILQVISKYMDIDRQAMDIQLANEDDEVALVANIPVKNMKYPGRSRRPR